MISLGTFCKLVSWLVVLILFSVRAKCEDFDDEPDPVIEACPSVGLNDTEISACFTRVFKNDILPYLGRGIPQLGIRSIDPVTLSNVSITFFNIGIVRLVHNLKDIVLTGAAQLTRSDFVVNRQSGTLTGHFYWPKIEGRSERTTIDGHIFGLPQHWFTKEGRVSFVITGLEVVTTYRLRPTNLELYRLANIEYDAKGFQTRAHGVARPAWLWFEAITNWITTRFDLPVFRYIIKPKFSDVFTDIMLTFMEPKAWNIIHSLTD